ncbi:MAG TPA: PAS domain S-box protein [Lysobacter sp.]|nr:PAS domain S-box protein [Lysobacter sp.]
MQLATDQGEVGDDARFRALAENIPNLCWMADESGWIFWYNRRWYEYTGTTFEEMQGWGWQRVHDPLVLPLVMARWTRALERGEPFEMVFPLKGADGVFRPFLTRVAPVREHGRIVRWFGSNTDVTELHALRQTQALHELIVSSAIDFAIITTDLEGRLTSWNVGGRNLFGYEAEEVIGQPADVLYCEEDQRNRRHEYEMRMAVQHGRIESERPRRRKDGSTFWGSGYIMPLRNAEGRHVGYLKIMRDRSEQRRQEEHRRLLVEELNHRVKNTLAIVQSIARQTFPSEGAAGDARAAFEGRLRALARAHDLLTRENWEAADLRRVVIETIQPHQQGESRFIVDGPTVRLGPKPAVTIAMALHELCVNATKYGALSVADGHVAIRWITTDGGDPRFHLTWEETGGPTVAPPARRGFGSRMIERALAQELDGRVEVHYRPAGVVVEISAPAPGHVVGRAEGVLPMPPQDRS